MLPMARTTTRMCVQMPPMARMTEAPAVVGLYLDEPHTRQPSLLLGAKRQGQAGAFSGSRRDELGKQSSHAGAELDEGHAESPLSSAQSMTAGGPERLEAVCEGHLRARPSLLPRARIPPHAPELRHSSSSQAPPKPLLESSAWEKVLSPLTEHPRPQPLPIPPCLHSRASHDKPILPSWPRQLF